MAKDAGTGHIASVMPALSLFEVKEGFERLSGLPLPEQELATCRVYLLQTVVLLGDYPAVIEMQQALFTEAIGKLEQYPEGETRQMQQIALALSYYQMLYVNLPDEYPSKKELMRKRFPGLMELSDVKRMRRVTSRKAANGRYATRKHGTMQCLDAIS